MRIKLKFDSTENLVTKPLNKEVNGFVNKMLGVNNEYHGKFSRYNVSSMQGGVPTVGGVKFPNGGFIYISSDDSDFMGKIIMGLISNGKGNSVAGMGFRNFEISDFDVNENFDLVRTISPICTRINGKAITFRDNNFCERILEVSKKKLINCGYEEKDVNTLDIQLFHPENAKTKMVEINGAKNIGNLVMFVVKGKKTVRKALYELGIGTSTGFGFGSVSINKNNK